MKTLLLAMLVIASSCGEDPAAGRRAELKTLEQTAAKREAAEILERLCLSCHGANGTSSGGFDFATDLEKLAASRLVVAGDAKSSTLYRRMADGSMPPASSDLKATADEIGAVADWINSLEKAEKLPSVALSAVTDAVGKDFAALALDAQANIFYVDMTHIRNSSTQKEYTLAKAGFLKALNSVSAADSIVEPAAINAEQSIFRVDIKALKWDEQAAQQLLATFPFGQAYGVSGVQFPRGVPKEEVSVTDDVQKRIGGINLPQPTPQPKPGATNARIVMADWFINAISRPPFYYSLPKTPNRLALFESDNGFNTVENLRQGFAKRAGFADSQVANQQRVIERHQGTKGTFLWRTFEFGSGMANKNIFAMPLGPGLVFAEQTEKRFVADGHEIIYELPNGLLGFAIFNGDGVRLDQAPAAEKDGIKENSVITPGASCMSCHARGLMPKADQVGKSVQQAVAGFTDAEKALVAKIYTLEGGSKIFEQDSAKYRKLLEGFGLTALDDDPVSKTAGRLKRMMDQSEAYYFLGITSPEAAKAAAENPAVQSTIGGLFISGSIDRQSFWSMFPTVSAALKGGAAPPGIDPPGQPTNPIDARCILLGTCSPNAGRGSGDERKG